MIGFLKIFFLIVLVSMLGITGWATGQCALWKVPHAVATHPWFIATLLDTYWAFLTFYCWVFYKEVSWLSRVLWLIAILLFGNIAMAVYMLVQLFRLTPGNKMEDLLHRRA